jgi:phospholipase C
MWVSSTPKRIADMADIQHVVVLMLENRSFDSMLGRLYPNDPDFRGLTLNEYNNYGGSGFGVWNDTGMTPATACIPEPDPGEAFTDMNFQLFGSAGRSNNPPAMCGFAENYVTQVKGAASAVMHYFTPEQVPVISTLAKAFGVSDCWHASAPCQTWPNRFFTHTGTSLGYVDNKAFPIPFLAPSIFGRLEEQNKTWRVYFHDMPQSMLLRDVWSLAISHYKFFNQFLADASQGTLPNYSFIEPGYFTDLFDNFMPNDEHPPHNLVHGEKLIADVYNALRNSRCWKNTLLIITYDEHGGCYDHVSPPCAVRPDNNVTEPSEFQFNFYGVRVPAVLVSPYIPPGSKIRPPKNADGSEPTPFDHTSIIKTLRELFDLGPQLTARDEAAPSLVGALSLAAPNNDGPASIDPTLVQPVPEVLSNRAAATPNGMQDSLANAAAQLPLAAPATDDEIQDAVTPAPAGYPTVALAAASATVRTNLFLGVSPQTS